MEQQEYWKIKFKEGLRTLQESMEQELLSGLIGVLLLE